MPSDDVLADLCAYKADLHTDGPLDKLLTRAIEEMEYLRSLVGAVSHDRLDFASIRQTAKREAPTEKTRDA